MGFPMTMTVTSDADADADGDDDNVDGDDLVQMICMKYLLDLEWDGTGTLVYRTYFI